MGELTFILYYKVSFSYKNFNGGGGLVAKSCPTLATPWIVACQAPLSVGFSRQEYWSGLPFLSPGDLPDPGIEPGSPALQTDSLLTELWGKCKNFNNKVILQSQSLPIRKRLISSRDWWAVSERRQPGLQDAFHEVTVLTARSALGSCHRLISSSEVLNLVVPHSLLWLCYITHSSKVCSVIKQVCWLPHQSSLQITWAEDLWLLSTDPGPVTTPRKSFLGTDGQTDSRAEESKESTQEGRLGILVRDQVGVDVSMESSGPCGLLPASREAPLLEVSPQQGTQRSLCRPQGLWGLQRKEQWKSHHHTSWTGEVRLPWFHRNPFCSQ